MQYGFVNEWNYKTIGLFALLLILPNFLGLININTTWGFNIHMFQIAVILAGLVYGPKGGLAAGIFGSAYSAMIMHNPYIIIGNAILGLCVGVFSRYKIETVVAVLLAYLVQIPWLVLSDYFFVGLSFGFIWKLVIALALSNIIWGLLAGYIAKPLKQVLQ